MFTIRSFPKAIVHVDGDAFFVSCETARNPKLRGKPVVTGGEKNIVSAMSYEAKRLGIVRAMPLHEARKICPQLIVVSSDFAFYKRCSERMVSILRRYTPIVEPYSIDECFADITGLRRPLHMSYEKIAWSMKRDLQEELGMTFSLGLSITKVLAKVASKHSKPNGFTVIRGKAVSCAVASGKSLGNWITNGAVHAEARHYHCTPIC
jgi:DNA polymerase IV